jgi:putative transposase
VPLRVTLRVIDPKNTSRECPKCHYVDKKNRNKNQFECLQCGYKDTADYVAAINIAVRAANMWPRAAVKQPIVADLTSSYKPPILIVIK